MLHHDVDYTPYEGMRITGWPVTTLVRGTRVWDRGEFRGEAGFGRFLPCGKPDMARPKVVDPVAADGALRRVPPRLAEPAGPATRGLIAAPWLIWQPSTRPGSPRRARADRSIQATWSRAFRQRIDDLNPTLNAVVGEVPRGLDADVALLRKRIARGESLPLAGVPVIVKDTIWVRDQRVTQGSLLFSDFVARQDALAVERLRRAGALVIGMGNSSEFACKGLTTNKVYGLTRHPMDPTLTPGGSSGGCAAAVAARLAPLALGTDGGGSSRRPPAHVGVVGFKPSFGAIADPIGFPHAFIGLQAIAPIARTRRRRPPDVRVDGRCRSARSAFDRLAELRGAARARAAGGLFGPARARRAGRRRRPAVPRARCRHAAAHRLERRRRRPRVAGRCERRRADAAAAHRPRRPVRR